MYLEAFIAIGSTAATLGLCLGIFGWLYARRYRRKNPDSPGNWKATPIGLLWTASFLIIAVGCIGWGIFRPALWPGIFVAMCLLMVALVVVAKILESRGHSLFSRNGTGA